MKRLKATLYSAQLLLPFIWGCNISITEVVPGADITTPPPSSSGTPPTTVSGGGTGGSTTGTTGGSSGGSTTGTTSGTGATTGSGGGTTGTTTGTSGSSTTLMCAQGAFCLDDSRSVPWNPGVSGGIPTYPLIGANIYNVKNYGAKGDGSTDDLAAVKSAIAAATNGSVVYFPAGTYYLSAGIQVPPSKQIVLRGAGPTSTFLQSYESTSGGPDAGNAVIVFGTDTSRTSQISITSGYTKGSKTLVLSSVSGLSVGQMAEISQANDPTVIFGTLEDPNYREQAQQVTITSISANTITIDRPLYYTYSASFGPTIMGWSNPATLSGVEDMSVEMKGNQQANIYFYVARQSWVRNVVSRNSIHAHILVSRSYQMEIRDSTVEYHQIYDSDNRVGIQVNLFATDCLIENNITQGNNLGINVQLGATGNVIGYNFMDQGFGNGYPTDQTLKGGIAVHGDNPNMNLFEGNVTPWASQDNYWGSNRSNTFFRNWMTRIGYYDLSGDIAYYDLTASYVDAQNYYHSYVGNILASPTFTGDPTSMHSHDVWEIGNDRRGGTGVDPMTQATLLQHGNFDFDSNMTQWTAGLSQTLPASYYMLNRYSGKPTWFGSLAWPAIGPDVNTTSTIRNAPVIPAQARWLGKSY